MSCAWLFLVKTYSEISYLPSIHVFQQWDSFCSQKLPMPLNLCSWSTFCSHSVTYPVLLIFFFCGLSYHDFSITLSFFFCHYLVLWNATWGFSLPSPSSFCLSLVLLRMSSLLIAVSFSYSLVHLLLLGDCYLIFVMPRNSLMWVWTVETYFFFCQGYLLRMQDEIHLFFRELSAVSW